MGHIDFIHIVHETERLFFSDILIQCAAEIVRNIVLSVGKGTCSAEAAHNRTTLTGNTGLHLFSVDGTISFF